jgi:adenine phosphoribosyltransferase
MNSLLSFHKCQFKDIQLEFFQDFPEPGVNFIDVGCVFDNPEHWDVAVNGLCDIAEDVGTDFLLAMDARGFMLAGAVAHALGIGFAMARKPGKLPGASKAKEYMREYGSASIEIQPERIKGSRVLILDDVIATGGTIEAAAALLRDIGKEPVGAAALFDLEYFKDKRTLTIPTYALRDI